jgi:septal ring factor EnvC (AmiA/AmiB activator)
MRFFLLITVLAFALTAGTAQTRKSVQQKARTTQSQKKTAPKARKQSQKAKGKAAPTVKGLQNQRQQLQQQIKEQERKLNANRQDVKQRLQSLQILNSEIGDKQRTIDTIRHDIGVIDGNISTLNIQLETLEKKMQERRANYMKSIRHMHRTQTLQNQLMFIFSAKNFTEMFRRVRFTREYAQFQRAQGEAIKAIKKEVLLAEDELNISKRQKRELLTRDEQAHRQLQNKQAEQQEMVSTLQKEQKTIENLISEQRKKDAALNAQIEKLIAEEIARAKARAEAEAKRKAAEAKRKAAEAAAKKRAEELARRKAAAEAAARENARRIAEAKAREERAKQQALAAARRSAEEKAAAERAARQAEQERRELEHRAAQEARAHENAVAEARKKERETRDEQESFTVSSVDRRLSGNFESNRGRLPMPITGGYRIVSGFGQNSVDGLRGVRLDSKGINIKGQSGAQARSVFDGDVCAVFNIGGVMGVMVRHGGYISVYTNLSSVSVRRGQKVSTRQILGSVNADGILHFQLRKGSAAQNPARWLGR